MKVDIMNVDKYVETNNLAEITNPIYFHKGNYPTEDGLFSYEIFGRLGSEDRKTTYAYIDLKDHYLHPLVYKNLIRLNRKFAEIIAGITYCIITEEGSLEIAEEDVGKTGIKFIYDNWDKIKYVSSESNKRDERIEFMDSVKKKDAFITKQIVIPAFYRDRSIESSGGGKVDEINDFYSKLIRTVQAVEENKNSGIEYVSNATKNTLQSILNDIYDFCINITKGKNGLFRRSIMGKSIDYSCRNVISEASYDISNTYKDMQVDMTHTGVPIATVINTFTPFIIKWCQDFFERELNNIKDISMIKNGVEKRVPLHKNAIDDFSYDIILEKIHLYTKAPSERFERIMIRTEDNKYHPVKFTGRNRQYNDSKMDSSIANRDLTWTDIFYQASVDVTKNKHIYVTRYPLEDYFGIYPSKVSVLSTFKTMPQYIEDTYYPYYPVIDPDMDKDVVSGLFVDSLQPFNAFLSGLGGDFDGDMVTIRGVFTQEANIEAERIMNNPTNILNLLGENNRPVSMECIQTLYDMTKE